MKQAKSGKTTLTIQKQTLFIHPQNKKANKSNQDTKPYKSGSICVHIISVLQGWPKQY